MALSFTRVWPFGAPDRESDPDLLRYGAAYGASWLHLPAGDGTGAYIGPPKPRRRCGCRHHCHLYVRDDCFLALGAMGQIHVTFGDVQLTPGSGPNRLVLPVKRDHVGSATGAHSSQICAYQGDTLAPAAAAHSGGYLRGRAQ